MAYIALYWGVMILGYFTASKLRDKADKFGFVNVFMLASISVLVFLMGIRMGSNEEVIANLGTIGVQSLVLTVLLGVGTIVMVSLTRKLLGIDKYGRLKAEHGETVSEHMDTSSEEKEEETKSSNLMTWLIIIFVTLGLLAGYFVARPNVSDMDKFNDILGILMTIGLSIMLLFVGFDLGLTGTVMKHLKTIGWRVLAFPAAILIATGIMGVIIGMIFPTLSIKESLAICYGFGWYTFAPIAIAGEGYVIASAISFMHNVIRELGGVMLLPLLAKKIGFIEVTSIPGVAAMDVCIPIIEKVTRPDIVVYSFAIGMVESFSVPILVPLIIGL